MKTVKPAAARLNRAVIICPGLTVLCVAVRAWPGTLLIPPSPHRVRMAHATAPTRRHSHETCRCGPLRGA